MEIQEFADNFIQLQDARKEADYDPICRPTLEQAQVYITTAELSINALYGASRKDQVAFSTWVLITAPGARHAREIQREGSKL